MLPSSQHYLRLLFRAVYRVPVPLFRHRLFFCFLSILLLSLQLCLPLLILQSCLISGVLLPILLPLFVLLALPLLSIPFGPRLSRSGCFLLLRCFLLFRLQPFGHVFFLSLRFFFPRLRSSSRWLPHPAQSPPRFNLNFSRFPTSASKHSHHEWYLSPFLTPQHLMTILRFFLDGAWVHEPLLAPLVQP